MVQEAREVALADHARVGVPQLGGEPARQVRGRIAVAVAGNGLEVPQHRVGAVAERMGGLLLEEEERDYHLRLEARTVDLAKVLERREAAQERPPLRLLERR